MRVRTLLRLLSLALVLAGSAVAGTWTLVDFPNAVSTLALGINDGGVVVGRYRDPNTGSDRGFVLNNGQYTTIEPPGSLSTWAYAVNSSGIICGTFQDGNGAHGFVFDGVTYTTLDYPNGLYTGAFDINDAGEVVGFYTDPGTLNYRGFMWSGGAYTAIDIPGALYTMVWGNDNRGHLVGEYKSSNQEVVDFVMNANHAIRNLPPSVGPNRTNDKRTMVGSYQRAGTRFNLVTNHLTRLRYRNSFATGFSDINNHGQIAGFYTEKYNSSARGIVYKP